MMAQTPAENWLRGPVGFAVISAMHLLVIYLIATAVGKAKPIEIPRTKVVFVEDRPVPPEPPPDMLVKFGDKPTVGPLPEPLPIDYPVDPPDDTAIIQIRTPDDSGALSGAAQLPVFGPRIDTRRPLSQPVYPPSEIRLAHEGRVLLRLRVSPEGRVLAVDIVSSSGFPALDQAAVRTALREWRLMPARQGDTAVEGIFSTWVRFDLTDR